MTNDNYIEITVKSLLSGHPALIKAADLSRIIVKTGKLCAVKPVENNLFLVAIDG